MEETENKVTENKETDNKAMDNQESETKEIPEIIDRSFTPKKLKEFAPYLIGLAALLTIGIIFLIISLVKTPSSNDSESHGQNPDFSVQTTPTVGSSISLNNAPTVTPTNTSTITPTSVPTCTPTNTPTCTPTNTPTCTPTNTPTCTPTSISPFLSIKESDTFLSTHNEYYGKCTTSVDTLEGKTVFLALPETGNEWLDSCIAEEASLFRDEVLPLVEKDGLSIDYYCRGVGIYVSVVFTAYEVSEDLTQTELLRSNPSVFSKTDKQKLSVTDMFYEPVFVILNKDVKDYLSFYSEEASLSSGFMTTFTYDTKNFEKFFIDENCVRFYFDEGDLEGITEAFIYDEMSLETAVCYMKQNTKGEAMGVQIRTDLDPNKPMLAFTFDDGPGAGTEKIVNTFLSVGGKCTFYQLGNHVGDPRYQNQVQMIIDADFEVASHSYSHPSFYTSSEEEIWNQMYDSIKIMSSNYGYCPRLFRVPGGESKNTQLGNLVTYFNNNFPFPIILWHVDSYDWKIRSRATGSRVANSQGWNEYFATEPTSEEITEAIYEQIVTSLKSSSDKTLILMHDIHLSTAEAIEVILPRLAAEGYQFVTTSELLYYKGLDNEPGHWYGWSALR